MLIDSLDADFPEGLGIITGQTGAGKSILLGALSLLTGAKADASLISDGADNCIVEGGFSAVDGAVAPLLEENGVEWAEDGSLLIRRVIYASGRSRCFVNDCPVALPLLADLAEKLIDIHSQHNNLILRDKRYQLRVLDFFAGNAGKLLRSRAVWKELQELRARKEEKQARLSALRRDYDYNQAQFEILNAASLRDGELAEIEAEHRQLANAEEINSAIAGALSLFEGGGERSLDGSLREAARMLGRIKEFKPSVGALAERLESARIEMEDIRESLEKESGTGEDTAERLAFVEERMSLIYSLFRKFSCNSEAALTALRDDFSSRILDSSSLEEEIASLERSIADKEAERARLVAELRARRTGAAPGLAAAILSDLKFMELDGSVFKVEVLPAEPGPEGEDSVLFAFSSTGRKPEDVAKCASGGEISRIMLSLKAQMARFTGMPTMIFDEIDTGVSGSAADAMGQMICRMGSNMQVLAVSHLPQVAAKGDAHFVVEKSADRTSLRRVQGRERVMEIARLLSGESITPEAVANAEALLSQKTF